MEAITPKYKILYAGKDITEDISRYATSIEYRDKVEGESDELRIDLEDVDQLWKGEWYPGKGDKLQLFIATRDSQTLVDCGTFEIDEIELAGPPDTVVISALAAGINSPLRTKKSKAYENTSLREIAKGIAKEHGFTIVNESNAGLPATRDISFGRVSQDKESDLSFLARIAHDYGFTFSIRGDKLVFASIYEIEKGNPVREIDKTDLTSYSIKDKTSASFAAASVKYHNPADGQDVIYTTTEQVNADGVKYTQVTKKDTIVIKSRVENKKQAEEKAKAALYRANSKQQSGSLNLEGDILLVSGNNFDLTGLGVLSGKYHICESTHTLTKSGGYATQLEIKRVGFIEAVKNKPKPRKKKTTYRVVG